MALVRFYFVIINIDPSVLIFSNPMLCKEQHSAFTVLSVSLQVNCLQKPVSHYIAKYSIDPPVL